MSYLDKAKSAARKAVEDHGDKVRTAADKAGDLIDEKTGGKHKDKIETGKRKVKDVLDSLGGKDDGIPGRP